MTFDDDFMRCGLMDAPLKQLGLEWPPPAFLHIRNHGELPDLYLRRVSYSEITDEQRARMTHVCRGAQYEPCAATDIPHDEPAAQQ